MDRVSLLEQGQASDPIAQHKVLLYDAARERLERFADDPSRNVCDPDNLATSIYLGFMDYRNWPENLGFFQRLSQSHAGNKAHIEGWFSQQSPFNKLAWSSVEGNLAPVPGWMRGRVATPLRWINRAYHWVWKGPHNKAEDGSFLKYRAFTNEFYRFHRVPLTANEMDRLYVFVHEQAGKPFNWWGSARSWSRRGYRKTDQKRWFCSEFMDASLRACGLYERLYREGRLTSEFVDRDSGMATPTLLFQNLCNPEAGIVYAADNQVLGTQRVEEYFAQRAAEPVHQIVTRTSRKPRKKSKKSKLGKVRRV
jgi:hypothetical protein